MNKMQAAWEIIQRINNCDLILRYFCTSKEITNKVKRKPTEWERILADNLSDKELLSRIHKESKNIKPPKFKDPLQKWASEMNTHFSDEGIQMANKYMRKCSPSLVI